MKSSFASPANLPSAYVRIKTLDSLPLEPVARDFILEIDFTDWRPDIVRVQPLVGRDVLQADFGTLEDLFKGKLVPGVGRGRIGFGTVDDAPVVVVVSVRIEGDLLFCLSAWSLPEGMRSLRLDPVG